MGIYEKPGKWENVRHAHTSAQTHLHIHQHTVPNFFRVLDLLSLQCKKVKIVRWKGMTIPHHSWVTQIEDHTGPLARYCLVREYRVEGYCNTFPTQKQNFACSAELRG